MTDGVGFTIDSNGYVGTGEYNNTALSQFWEYTFDNSPSLGITPTSIEGPAVSAYPNPAKNTVTINYSGIEIPATIQ